MSAVRAARTLARGERAAEALMIDQCVVSRVERVQQADYTYVSTEVPVYAGACKVQTYEPDAVDVTSGGRPVTVQEYRLHVPNGVGPFKIGDVAVVAGFPWPFRVDGLILKTFQTAQRLKVSVQANRASQP